MKSFADGFAKGWTDLKLDIQEQWIIITESVKDVVGKMYEAGAAIVQALLDGLKAKWAEVETWVANSIKNLIPDWAPSWLKDSLGLTVDGKPGEDGKTAAVPKDAASRAEKPEDSGAFLKDILKTFGRRAFGPQIDMPAAASNVIKFEPPKVKTPRLTLPAVDIPSVSSVISLQDAIRARAAGIGGNTTDTAPGKMKDDLNMGAPKSINASNLTVGSVNMPEPIVAHEPQSVSAPFTVNLTVNAQGDANAIAGAVKSALASQAAQQAAAVKSSFSD